MFQPSAKVILDSVAPDGSRLLTMELRMHRSILAQFNKHRLFSSNTASTRAIPTRKYIEQVIEDDVQPMEWGTNGKGMQPQSSLSDVDIVSAQAAWINARDTTISIAQDFARRGVHKEIVNKLLDAFAATTVICTGDEGAWLHFLMQRMDKHAQSDIRFLANAANAAMNNSEPEFLPWNWTHRPYVLADEYNGNYSGDELTKVSVARCARVSYLNHEQTPTFTKDLELYSKLVDSDPPHLSPLEHVAQAERGRFANFTGWKSARYKLEEANDLLCHRLRTQRLT